MTREEQLACLKDRPCSVCKFHTDRCNRWTCVFEDEPEEQEPCEDVISRDAVLKQINCWIGSGEYRYAMSERFLIDRIKTLPPVTPKPKTGHWKKLNVGYGCSECSLATNKSGVDFYRFCPNCGARMSESKYVAELAKSFAQGLRQGVQDGFSESEGV